MNESSPSVYLAVAFTLTCLVACGPAPVQSESSSAGLAKAASFTPGARVHVMPRAEPGSASLLKTAATPTANLVYYGGHVISNVKVVQVLYGSGTYIPEVTDGGVVNGGTTINMASFFRDVTASPYIDWLSEYDTDVTANAGVIGTGQHIGRGTYVGQFVITPSTSGTTLDDTQISAELNAQIGAGHLPESDANTLYMIYFPRGLKITQGGSTSCASGGFCAYHGTFTRNGQSAYYGVLPDMGPGSGCDTGCGSSTVFQNETSVSSHEMIEALTDAEVGLATANAPPLAWYDPNPNNGEIGDICNAQQATLAAGGHTYTVQKEWSNRFASCISVAPSPNPTNDFFVRAAPTALSASTCAPVQGSVPLMVTSGSAVSVALTTQNLPAGVTAAFNPSTLNSDGTATLTLTVAPGTALKAATPFQVVATSSSKVHVAPATFAVTPPATVISNLPADKTVEASSSAGAVVTFNPAAAYCLTAANVSCLPASGTTFALGSTTAVTCTADDGAGHTSTGVFHVTVQDKTPPALNLPPVMSVEATSASGATVSYTPPPSAMDLVDGNEALSCDPASGTAFSFGTTQVTCTAKDSRNNVATGTFNVVVADTTPPALTCPANVQTMTADSSATVTFGTATAVDSVSDATVTYSVASGSSFPLGTTPVQVTATDAAGNHSSCTFKVVVRPPNTAVTARVGCSASGGPGSGAALALLGLLILSARRRSGRVLAFLPRTVSFSRRKPGRF